MIDKIYQAQTSVQTLTKKNLKLSLGVLSFEFTANPTPYIKTVMYNFDDKVMALNSKHRNSNERCQLKSMSWQG